MKVALNHDPAANRYTLDVDATADGFDPLALPSLLAERLQEVPADTDADVDLWIHDVDDDLDRAARDAGFIAYRDLWQLRCDLPAEPSTLETRSFTDADADAMIGVNNRAFSWHPEQSGLDRSRLAATMAEPWFDPDGFRLFEIDGELKGFCWTKIHADEDPPLGEIFVIAVDPSAHGQGLGSPMTRAGLDWLSAQGLRHGMLYVESDNVAANRVYERIGFRRHRTDRAYRLGGMAAA